MKKILILNIVVALGMNSSLYANELNCVYVPEGVEVVKALEVKKYDKAEVLLAEFKVDVKSYLDNCDNSEDMFEQTHINILTYEDKLADLKEDLKIVKTIDCSNPPRGKKLDTALRNGNSNKIQGLYDTYKVKGKSYFDHCVLDEKYAFVFEESIHYDEDYDTWKKGLKL